MSAETSQELVIEAGRSVRNYWRDVWRFRDLFIFLAWRDVLVRYKQTVFGIAWAWIRPLLTMITFTVVFGKLAKLPSEDAPYSVLVMIGLLPWQFFSTAFGSASTSLLDNANLISKVYFPRIIVPTSVVMVVFIDLLVGMVLLVGLMGWTGTIPDWRVVALPLFVVQVFVLSVGLGLWVAALNVRYRDFRHVVPFLLQIGLYASPVGFSSTIVPEKWRLLYACNPMVGVIDGFRWSLLGGKAPLDWTEFALGMGVTLAVLILGIRQFRRTERTFADEI